MKTRKALGLFTGLLLVVSTSIAGDWPQFGGPDRDNHAKEPGLGKKWSTAAPKVIWNFANTGLGYSAPSVVGDKLFILGAREDSEYLIGYDIKNQKELWPAVKLGALFTWKSNNWNAGPSATPTVSGDNVYALSGRGDLVCATTAGKEVWRKSMVKDFEGEVNPVGGNADNLLGWGYTWSPLVDGNKLICVPGGKKGLLVTLDKTNGKELWRSKEVTDQATYSSPIVAEVQGVRQYIAMTNQGTVGVKADTGALLWYYKRTPVYNDCVIPTPLYHDNHVYTTVGMASLGCDLIKLTKDGDKFKAEKVYSNRNTMHNRDGGVVLVDDRIYGYSDGKGWVCQDFKTGKLLWSEKRKMKAGSIIAVDGLLLLYGAEDGTVVLLKPDAKKWDEVARFAIPQKSEKNQSSGKIWTHPVVANGRLFLRDQELLFCFQ
jgi:outer membrane protein assembly factor BamB